MATPNSAAPTGPDRWSEALACAFVAGDLTVSGIARYAGLHVADASDALAQAHSSGLVGIDGTIDESEGWRLVAGLAPDRVAEVHLAAARHLFAAGPGHQAAALAHARAAGSSMPLEELVTMADQGGRLSLALGDHTNARDLLSLASEFDTSSDHGAMARRLLDLARALDMLGDVSEARRRLAQALVLGELVGDAHLVARAAVEYALPVDWYAGDPRTVSLLQRAEAMDLDDDDRVMVMAARSMVEMRIPLAPEQPHQIAWVTRPEIAQDLSETALRKSEACRDDVSLLAMLAWRSTHRAPEFLDRRRDLSTAALDLAQHLREPGLQLVAAVWLAVDALESGDRPLYDRALGVARWVAHSTGNPRLLWQASTLGAGAAFLDGDLATGPAIVADAARIGSAIDHPGHLGATLLFGGQEVVSRDDPDEIGRLPIADADPVFANPLGRATYAYLRARCGDLAAAERHARTAFRQVDPEASMLLLCSRLAAVALLVDAPDLSRDLVDTLGPWSDHVAVDSNGWWCDGPVDLWLALLHEHIGDPEAALTHLDRGEVVARAINDVRALDRARALRSRLDTDRTDGTGVDPSLTAREAEVLRLIAAGYSNPQIATRLSFSLSTIRSDTTVIYRKLGVATRAAAVAEAITRGIVREPRSGR